MAFIDNSGAIIINRGECFESPLFINIGTDEEPIRLNFKEFSHLNIEVYLGVHLQHHPFECSFIKKCFNHLNSNSYGDIIIKIDSQDTLYILPGDYLYTIKARMYDEKDGEWVSTVIDRKLFRIL